MSKEDFLKDVDNWCNHRHFLWEALEATKHLRLPVLELGCGHGSTPFLQKYCADEGLELFSYDFNPDYAKEFGGVHVEDWNYLPGNIDGWKRPYSVALIDESPGEHRKDSIQMLTHVKVVVIHDSEPDGWNASDYQVRQHFDKYKYHTDYKAPKPGAWATALSNYIDVTQWK